MKTADAYWREHDFGRGGRPASGTPLTVSISGYGVPVGVTCGRVLPYDGRWVSSSFPADAIWLRAHLCVVDALGDARPQR